MKRILIAVACLSIALILCVAEFICVTNTTERIIMQTQRVAQEISKGNTELALEKAKELEASWGKTVAAVDMLLYHDNVDHIEAEIKQLVALLKLEKNSESITTCVAINQQLQILKEGEYLNLKNLI